MQLGYHLCPKLELFSRLSKNKADLTYELGEISFFKALKMSQDEKAIDFAGYGAVGKLRRVLLNARVKEALIPDGP